MCGTFVPLKSVSDIIHLDKILEGFTWLPQISLIPSDLSSTSSDSRSVHQPGWHGSGSPNNSESLQIAPNCSKWLQIHIWSHLELFGAIWSYSELFGVIWRSTSVSTRLVDTSGIWWSRAQVRWNQWNLR